MSTPEPAWALSEDRMTLQIRQQVPGGVIKRTVHRQREAGPFTDEDVAKAVSAVPSSRGMQPGQRNTTRRAVTRFGTLWVHVMHGPPTWWAPKLRREKDGTVMAGWLRLAVAVRFERENSSNKEGRTPDD